MQLNPIASAIIVVSYVVATLLLIVLLGALVYLLFKVYGFLVEFQGKLDPLIGKIDGLLTVTTEKVDSIGGKTEAILAEGEAAAEAVHDRVERTAAVVQQTVSRPIVGVNALVAGVVRGAATFASLQSRNARSSSLGGKYTSGNLEDLSVVELYDSTAEIALVSVGNGISHASEATIIVTTTAPEALVRAASAGIKE